MASQHSINNYDHAHFNYDSDVDDYSNPDPSSYFRDMSLRYFAAAPLSMVWEHYRLKELCLTHDNPEAHYIEGVLGFFHHKEENTGLYHLRKSALLNNKNGMYLYGKLMLATGNSRKGKKYLDKLHWWERISTTEHCWARIQNSLRNIDIPMNNSYNKNMVNLRPRRICNGHEIGEVCAYCYYYKRLTLYRNPEE